MNSKRGGGGKGTLTFHFPNLLTPPLCSSNAHVQAAPLSKQHQALVPSISDHLPLLGQGRGGVEGWILNSPVRLLVGQGGIIGALQCSPDFLASSPLCPCITQNTYFFPQFQPWMLTILTHTRLVRLSIARVQGAVLCVPVELDMHPDRQFPGQFVVHTPSRLHVLRHVSLAFPWGPSLMHSWEPTPHREVKAAQT